MEIVQWYVKVLKQYADFSGRARRKEYWIFFFVNLILSFVFLFIPVFGRFLPLALLIPSIAVGVRRLHDIGKSGLMMFIYLIPLVGPIWMIVLFATEGEPKENQYGPNPKEVSETPLNITTDIEH